MVLSMNKIIQLKVCPTKITKNIYYLEITYPPLCNS